MPPARHDEYNGVGQTIGFEPNADWLRRKRQPSFDFDLDIRFSDLCFDLRARQAISVRPRALGRRRVAPRFWIRFASLGVEPKGGGRSAGCEQSTTWTSPPPPLQALPVERAAWSHNSRFSNAAARASDSSDLASSRVPRLREAFGGLRRTGSTASARENAVRVANFSRRARSRRLTYDARTRCLDVFRALGNGRTAGSQPESSASARPPINSRAPVLQFAMCT